MATTALPDRVVALLARPSLWDALQSDDDLIDTLTAISSLSEAYIPVLQFLMRPDNLAGLVFCLLDQPSSVAPTATATATTTIHESFPPTYSEYAVVYRAHWVLCVSEFSSQLISALLALHHPYPDNLEASPTTTAATAQIDLPPTESVSEPYEPPSEGALAYDSICQRLSTYDSRDSMNLEVLVRFLTCVMDQYSPDTLLSFLGAAYTLPFMQTLLVLVHYEPMREVLLRICNEIPGTVRCLHRLTKQFLHQLSPWYEPESAQERPTTVSEAIIWSRMARDATHHQFARMIFTCDLVTDLIHEKRQESLGFFFIHELSSTSMDAVTHLLNAAAYDLTHLPTTLANESYVLKVLNSLLQQAQCGCVAKINFVHANGMASGPSGVHSDAVPTVDDTELSPHVDLPLIWKVFITRLPEFLPFLHVEPPHRYTPTHVQLIYLMLPILNVSCRVVDLAIIAHDTMGVLLQLALRFPQANILHCAISRLFIVALEDSPFLFGRELPAFRASNDALRLHLLLHGCFERVMDVYDEYERSKQGRSEDNSDTSAQSSSTSTSTSPPPPSSSSSPSPEAATITDALALASASQRHRQRQQHSIQRPPPALIDIAISFDQAVTSAQAHDPHLFAAALITRWCTFRDRVLLPTQVAWEEQYQFTAATDEREISSPRDMDIDRGYAPPTHEPPAVAPGVATGPPTAVISPTRKPPDQKAAEYDVPTPLAALYDDEERFMIRGKPESEDNNEQQGEATAVTSVVVAAAPATPLLSSAIGAMS